ncbi:hypothetical protein ACFVSS_17470 [Peribacillus butanolivorans]|uniref:hypothetical protein n=1 Tax=Peribacillus butanolivorans TaxID=421767 RepID=UPI0036D9D71C
MKNQWSLLWKPVEDGMELRTLAGNYKDPDNLLREFNRYIWQAGVPYITIHDF